MRVALYSCLLYGKDFIVESINSILPFVDKVFVVCPRKPWGHTEGVEYKGVWEPWPEKFDDSEDRVRALAARESKVSIWNFYWHEPTRVVLQAMNQVVLPHCAEVPREILHMSVDCVFRPDQAEAFFSAWEAYAHPGAWAYSNQVESWKTPAWRIQPRPRSGVSIHRLSGVPIEWPKQNTPMPMIGGFVHNLGFAASPEVMLWKHKLMIAMTQSGCQDSEPNVDWYDRVWSTWHPVTNNQNLEPSLRCEAAIPCAYAYDVNELPASIQRRYRGGEWEVYT